MGKIRELEGALWDALNIHDPHHRKAKLDETLSKISEQREKSSTTITAFPELKNELPMPHIVDCLEIENERVRVFVEAIRFGDVDHYEYVTRVKNAYTPIMKAIELNDIACVKALLEANADVNKECYVNNMDGSPLNIVAAKGLGGWVDILLEAKADVNGKSSTRGYDPDRDYSGRYTALMEAAASGSAHCVNSLLAAKANIHAKTDFRFFGSRGTALSIATKRGNTECIRALNAEKNEHKIAQKSKQ